ncbi:hypothetical protein ACQR1W_13915 [Bradyrhizobium sp. HKCCYLS1011]|uniref:hypothetical protein n=1 Tax=Bradyrhizobium sp. HKCCYLS1011 TaxID=3420733 RepID=UPI003EC071A4
MQRWVLGASLTVLFATTSLAEDLFWVVGDRAADRCAIVTSNPVIVGDIWFADGPYKSLADAKLARSTIGACPNKQDPADD